MPKRHENGRTMVLDGDEQIWLHTHRFRSGTHNEQFQKPMKQHLPDWKHRREVLNRLPVRHEDWGY